MSSVDEFLSRVAKEMAGGEEEQGGGETAASEPPGSRWHHLMESPRQARRVYGNYSLEFTFVSSPLFTPFGTPGPELLELAGSEAAKASKKSGRDGGGDFRVVVLCTQSEEGIQAVLARLQKTLDVNSVWLNS